MQKRRKERKKERKKRKQVNKTGKKERKKGKKEREKMKKNQKKKKSWRISPHWLKVYVTDKIFKACLQSDSSIIKARLSLIFPSLEELCLIMNNLL